MKNKLYTVSIIGVGNIGYRYFQSILRLENIKLIKLFETDFNSLQKRLNDLSDEIKGKITINEFITKDIIQSEIIIISTTSSQRFGIAKELINLGYKGDIILEKILVPDIDSLKKLENLFKFYKSKIYVNQWMRLTPLKNILDDPNINELIVKGRNMGLLCNSVHFIDLISGTFGIKDFIVDLQKSKISKIFSSKRKNYYEVNGTISWYSDKTNKRLTLIDNDSEEISNKINLFTISNEYKKEYILSEDKLLNLNTQKYYKIPYLSEHASQTISNILGNNDPIIPSLKDSITHHMILFNALNLLVGDKSKFIKIT